MNIDQLNKIRKIRVELSKVKFKDITENDFADYPWEDCVKDQIKAYGSKDIAEKVCGKIKSENASKEEFVIPTPNAGEDENTFISRCISDIYSEYDQEGQAYAICKGKWDEK